jgi:DNA polymerase-3 subunit delta
MKEDDFNMDVKTALKQIQSGKILPIYICFGTEKYQLNQFIKKLQDTVVDQDGRDFGLATYDLAETPVEMVVEEAEMLPFLVPQKLIVVRDSSIFTAGKDNQKIGHNIDALIAYINNPAPHSVIVFVVNAEKLDERKKIVKLMKGNDAVISFMPLSANDLITWVVAEAKSRGCVIRQEAAQALIQASGVHMGGLASELDKLCLFVGQGQEIEVEAINQLVERNTEQNVFVMVEHIANLKLDEALNIFYELLKQREEPIKIVALIARQFRIMLQVKELGAKNYSQQQIASQLSLHPYGVKVAGDQARRFEATRLKQLLARLAQLDYEMKSGKMDKVLGLELFLLHLAA